MPATTEPNLTTAMAFLAYTPRADSDARDYEQWLRTVDNPFFNARQGIAHYTNWKLARGDARRLGFTHFDFLRFADGASPTQVLGNPVVQRFIGEWTRLWGRVPDGAPADNCACYLAVSKAAPVEADETRVALSFDGDDGDDADGELWTIVAGLVGDPPFHTFRRRFFATDDPGYSRYVAELIAGPGAISVSAA